MDSTWYTTHWAKIRWPSIMGKKHLGIKWTIVADFKKIWTWGQIRWNVDLISFPRRTWTTQSESVCYCGVHHKLLFFCSPNPTPKRVGLGLFNSLHQKWLVAWWRTLETLALGPQSTSLTFQVFTMQSNLPLTHVSNSEKENVQTLRCSINP